jgi:hypothetical protein
MKREDSEFFLLLVSTIFMVISGGLSAYEFSKKASSPELAMLLGAIALLFLVPTLVLVWRRKIGHRFFTWAVSICTRALRFMKQHPLFAGSLVAVCLLLYLLQRQIQDIVLTGIATGLALATICLALGAIRLLRTTRPSYLGLSFVPSEHWCYDFIEHFDDPTTTKSCQQGSQIQVEKKAQSLGIVKPAIFEHPPLSGKTALTYVIDQVPYHVHKVKLEFFSAILDEMRDETTSELIEVSRFHTVAGNRIWFEICVDEGLVFHEERASIGWSELKSVGPLVPVNNRLNVSFRTDALGHPEWNWAAWGEPRLIDITG